MPENSDMAKLCSNTCIAWDSKRKRCSIYGENYNFCQIVTGKTQEIQEPKQNPEIPYTIRFMSKSSWKYQCAADGNIFLPCKRDFDCMHDPSEESIGLVVIPIEDLLKLVSPEKQKILNASIQEFPLSFR